MYGKLVGVALAAVLGIAAGRVTRPAPAVPEASPRAPMPRDCGERRRVLQAEDEHLGEQLKIARLRLELQEARRVRREGATRAWSEGVDPRLRPEVFEPAVRDAAAQAGLPLIGIDCTEPPCLAAVQARPGEGNSSTDYDGLFEALRADGYEGLRSNSAMVGGGEDRFAVVTMHADLDDTEAQRLVHRMRAMQEATAERLEAER